MYTNDDIKNYVFNKFSKEAMEEIQEAGLENKIMQVWNKSMKRVRKYLEKYDSEKIETNIDLLKECILKDGFPHGIEIEYEIFIKHFENNGIALIDRAYKIVSERENIIIEAYEDLLRRGRI